jgi:hypothetical protein
LLLYEANNTEEPCARKPHAGICEGAVGKLAVLPQLAKPMEQNLYIRLLEFGLSQPDGFSHAELEAHLNLNEWETKIVNKFVELALNTGRTSFARDGSYIPDSGNTIFVLISNDHPVGGRFILSHNAFFSYLDYLELQSARETSKSANRNAKLALWAVCFTTLISIAVSISLAYWQVESPVSINDVQYKAMLECVEKDGSSRDKSRSGTPLTIDTTKATLSPTPNGSQVNAEHSGVDTGRSKSKP